MIRIELQPHEFKIEETTIWSFKNRGDWATHSGSYRGNWSPYVPRNLILRYSNPGDWVLDQFCGSGTTLAEAKLLGRNAIGVDINPHAILLAKKNTNFTCNNKNKLYINQGDARNLSFLKTEKTDLICMHPPYSNIIKYSSNITEDLSLFTKEEFLKSMVQVADESYRVLKPQKICALMMGDIRSHGNVIPLGFQVMEIFLKSGFKNKEIIIKEQHNCKSTPYWKTKSRNFLLLAHEYIFVFEK